MVDKPHKCPSCEGQGYHLCECWPGDCICGFGDTSCEDCMGEGMIYPDDHDDDHYDFREPENG